MSDPDLWRRINQDTQESATGRVLYLEGPTDVAPMFALVGQRAVPIDHTCDGVLLKSAGGAHAVRARVETARQHRMNNIFGIVDADGDLSPSLGAGPLFTWPAYCIENMLALACWPSEWGPLGSAELESYAPYVGRNRLHLRLRRVQRELGLQDFTRPRAGQALDTEASVRARLAAATPELAGLDLIGAFDDEVATYRRAIGLGGATPHTWLDGKFLLSHLAVTRARVSAERCRDLWCSRVADAPRLPEVSAVWDIVAHGLRGSK